MKKIIVRGMNGREVPAVIVGCMRQAGFTDHPFTPEQMLDFIRKALDKGAYFFDHADIYGIGRAEETFGKALALDPGIHREDLILQSKCGIQNGFYDSSKEHILEAVDGSLKRLQTDYLDILLLHRPDALMEPEEVAEAFDILESSGKVRYFGVSNYTPGQIELLKTCVKQKIIINQMECSIVHAGMISSGIEANMTSEGSFDHDGDILNYCRKNEIVLQAWSPFQISLHEGSFIDHDAYEKLNEELSALAEKYGTTKTGIAAAWLLRHPAGMQVVVGMSKSERLAEVIDAGEIQLTRKEWYALYTAAGHILP